MFSYHLTAPALLRGVPAPLEGRGIPRGPQGPAPS